MRRFLKKILTKPVTWLANKFSSRPNLQRVHAALSALYEESRTYPGKNTLQLTANSEDAKFIVFSDQHKGAKDGSDDFMVCEKSYLTALEYYLQQGFHFISLGDEEELWENTVTPVKENNPASIALQKKFLLQQRYTKIFGNHDLFWKNDPFAGMQLKSMYGEEVKIYEAVLLKIKHGTDSIDIFLTHGHQGDGQSDSNWFSAWFVGRVWAPLQSYLELNPNVPSASDELKTVHNLFMYQWSVQEEHPVLITGHTHQPVFASLTHIEQLYKQLEKAMNDNDTILVEKLKKDIHFKQQDFEFITGNYANTKPYYFNSGCCCFVDGDITGIEIEAGKIRLIKWDNNSNAPVRIILEEMPLAALL